MSELTWDLDSGGGGSKVEFAKFSPGLTKIRVLDPAPYVRWIHWLNAQRKSINCPGMNICPIDDIIEKEIANGVPNAQRTHTRARRYSMNIWNYNTNQVEIMEQGKNFMEDLKMLMQIAKDKGKKLSDFEVHVRRTGTGKDDTRYRLDLGDEVTDPIPEGLTDMPEYFKPHTPEQILAVLQGADWNETMYPDNKEEEAKPQVTQNGTADAESQDEEIGLS